MKNYAGRWMRCRSGSRASEGIFEIDAKRAEQAQLDRAISREDLWQDPKRAQDLLRQRANLQEAIQQWERLQKQVEEQSLLLELAEAEEEVSVAGEIGATLPTLEQEVAQAELSRMLSGPDDAKNA
ncbi:MAG: PCRF domain-containing protein, partial [Candidatus Entotheonellia bacterium]